MIPQTGKGTWIMLGIIYVASFAVLYLSWWLGQRHPTSRPALPTVHLACLHCIGDTWLDPETLESESFHEFGCPVARQQQLI